MKLSTKQKQELDIILWFVPGMYKGVPITDEDIKVFFAYSDKGIGKEEILSNSMKYGRKDGVNALFWGKQRRDLQISEWLEDWGGNINAWTFEDEPEHIAMWIADKLGKPAIKWAWYEARVREYRRKAYAARKDLP